MLRSSVLLLALVALPGVLGGAPPHTRLLDDDALIVAYPNVAVSPNGRWVAYVSRGFVCVVPPDGASPPRRLREIPDCESHLLARPEHAHANDNLDALVPKDQSHQEEMEAIGALQDRITATVLDLRWTPDSTQLVWGVSHRDTARESLVTEFWASLPDGDPRPLCRIAQRDPARVEVGRGYLVSHDLRYLVQPRQGGSNRRRPLIWDVSANRPRATPFLYLTSSRTSDRWIGLEKDTRQLVVTDANFEIRQRYRVFRKSRSHGFELLWSPDERFIVWRNQIGMDHYSNWEGFAMDLESGEKLDLAGRYMRESFTFTGRGGEFLRSRSEGDRSRVFSGTNMTGSSIRLHRSLHEEPRELWRRNADPTTGRAYRFWIPPPHASRDGRRFAVCLPDDDATKPGCHWRLIDRNGEGDPLPRSDDSAYMSPCNIAGFADGDRVLIGYTTKELFAIPIDPAADE